jgi:hypothetical protein
VWELGHTWSDLRPVAPTAACAACRSLTIALVSQGRMDEAREALAKMRQLAIRHADVSRRNLCSEALNSPRAVLRSATGSSAAKAGSQPLSLVRQERNFWMRRQGTRNRCQRQRTPAGTKKAPRPGAKIPAQTAYLNLMGNYPVRNGWMVGTTGIEPVTPTMSR